MRLGMFQSHNNYINAMVLHNQTALFGMGRGLVQQFPPPVGDDWLMR